MSFWLIVYNVVLGLFVLIFVVLVGFFVLFSVVNHLRALDMANCCDFKDSLYCSDVYYTVEDNLCHSVSYRNLGSRCEWVGKNVSVLQVLP